MKYFLVEIQTHHDDQVSLIPTVHDTIQTANQVFHTKLSYAAVTTLKSHAVVMLNETGTYLKHEVYYGPESSEDTPVDTGDE